MLILIISCTNKDKPTKEDKRTEIYLPSPGTTWQWQLSGKINTNYNVELYDVDLFETSIETINELHNRNIKVICYFSAGTLEEYREDYENFPKEIIGKSLLEWPDEKWLDISNYKKFSDIMAKRMDLAVEKNCDGIEPDNVDAYTQDSGFNLSYDNQLEYNKWLAEEAHKRNLSIALKNDLNQVKDLVNYFDFAINEQCFLYNECELLLPFIKQNKAVLGVEYELDLHQFCKEANSLNFSWLKMDLELDGSRESCNN